MKPLILCRGDFYRIGAEIARVEQAITHAREKSQQYQDDLEQAEHAYQDVYLHLQEDEEKYQLLQSQLTEIEPEFEQARELEEQSAAMLQEHESAMQDWQIRWDEFNQKAQEPSQTAQIERTKISQLEQNILNQERRIEKLQEELNHFSTTQIEEALTHLETELASSEEVTQTLQEQLDHEREVIQTQRDENYQLTNELDKQRSHLQSLKGRKASLEALQQAALGKNDKPLKQWLERHQIIDRPRLAEQISVLDNWNTAVECVLGDYLEATCLENIEPLGQYLAELEQSSLALIETRAAEAETPSSTIELPLLQQFISGSHAAMVADLTRGVFAAEDLATALEKQQQLTAGQSIITRDGIWLGVNWIRIIRDSDHKGGVLAREQELKQLDTELEEAQQLVDELSEKIEQGRAYLREIEHNRENRQKEFNLHNRTLSELRSQYSSKQSRLEQMHNRQNRVQEEIAEIEQQIEEHKTAD